MYERRRARVLLAALSLVSLGLVTLDAKGGAEGPVAQLRDATAAAFAPLQEGVEAVIRPLGGAFGGVVELFRLRSENSRLRAEVERLQQRHRSTSDVTRENRSLKALLDMRDRLTAASPEFELQAARVIALAPSNFEWTVTIDVGSRDGVRHNMTVINGDGLVGRVVQVTPTAARVLLAVDRSFAAAVRLSRTGENGYVEGGGTDPMRLNLLDPEADVREGDEVVTASYRNATFPEGIPVGAVAEVGEQTGDLSRDVLVRPYVDFTSLDVVTVVLRAPPPNPFPVRNPATAQPGAEATPTATGSPAGSGADEQAASPPAEAPPSGEPEE